MAGDVQIMESTGKNTRRERNRRTPVQPPKKEHKISLMKVGISFLIVIALVLWLRFRSNSDQKQRGSPFQSLR